MVLVAAAIATAPSVLIQAVPVWIVAVAWGFGCLGMGLVISSTSVLLLQLSAPEEAGANSAALQISDGLSNVVLLAVGGAAFAALGGGAVGAAHGADGGRRGRIRRRSRRCSCPWPWWRWSGRGWPPGYGPGALTARPVTGVSLTAGPV